MDPSLELGFLQPGLLAPTSSLGARAKIRQTSYIPSAKIRDQPVQIRHTTRAILTMKRTSSDTSPITRSPASFIDKLSTVRLRAVASPVSATAQTLSLSPSSSSSSSSSSLSSRIPLPPGAPRRRAPQTQHQLPPAQGASFLSPSSPSCSALVHNRSNPANKDPQSSAFRQLIASDMDPLHALNTQTAFISILSLEQLSMRIHRAILTRIDIPSILEHSKEWEAYLIESSVRLSQLVAQAETARKDSRWDQVPSVSELCSMYGTTIPQIMDTVFVGLVSREVLINAHAFLVRKTVRKYHNVSRDVMEELMQDGALAIIKAAETFDPKHTVQFSTYAGYWVERYVHLGYLEKCSAVRVPAHVYSVYKKHLRGLPSRGNITTETMNASLVACRPALSLNASVFKSNYSSASSSSKHGSQSSSSSSSTRATRRFEAGRDGLVCLGDLVANSDEYTEEDILDQIHVRSFREDLDEFLTYSLTPREKIVIEMRFGLVDGKQMSFRELGELLHVSSQRVLQIQRLALKKLRDNFRMVYLRHSKSSGANEGMEAGTGMNCHA